MNGLMQGARSTDRTGPRRWLRSLATLLSLLVAGLAIADTAQWFRLEHALDRRVAAFRAKAAALGWSLQAERGQRGGWPFAATVTLRGPRLDGAARLLPEGIGWSGEAIEMSLSLLHPAVLQTELRGTQSLHLGALSLRGWGAVLLLRSQDDRITLDAEALHLALAGAGPDDILQAAGLSGELHWRPDRPGGTDLSVTARALAAPMPSGETDRRVVQRARLIVRLEGALPGGDAGWPAAVGLWRAGGGAIRLDEASLDWGQDGDPDRGNPGASLSGRAVPNDDGTLDGSFTLDLTHADRVLATLRHDGVIGAGQQTALGAVIGLVAAGEHPSGPEPQIHLPLTLRRGVLRLGEIPLLTLPSP